MAALRAVLRGIGELAPLSDESLDVLIAAATPLSFTPGESVLLVGTGLTMADVTLAAAAETNDQITILHPPLLFCILLNSTCIHILCRITLIHTQSIIPSINTHHALRN